MMQSAKFTDRSRKQDGFALLEVLLAMVVLTIGLCAVLGAIGAAVTGTESAQEDLIARHKALDALESIYTARNSQQIPFAEINNVSSGGIFVNNAQPLLCAGPDGLVGTADDVACTSPDNGDACPNSGVECLYLPGDNGILGAGNYNIMSLANFTRTIAFNQVLQTNGTANPNLIAVTITVSYTKPNWQQRSYTVNALISAYH
jgi:prepilin-type N-terminal cleavage/methylation domain-containing protein